MQEQAEPEQARQEDTLSLWILSLAAHVHNGRRLFGLSREA